MSRRARTNRLGQEPEALAPDDSQDFVRFDRRPDVMTPRGHASRGTGRCPVP